MSQCRTQKRWGCFCTVPFFFCAFTQSGEKAFNTLREALKERCWPRLKLKYVPGGWELRLDLFFYFHFLRGFCSNFPAISHYVWAWEIVSVGFQENWSGFTPSFTHDPFRENASTLLGMAACVNESVNQTFYKSWPTKFTPDVRDLSRNLEFM